MLTESEVISALRDCYDPELPCNIVDLGLAGIPSSANGGGARDIGTGDDPSLKLSIIVTTAFASGTSLQVNLQGAPDNGSGAPGSWTTMWTGPVVVEAFTDPNVPPLPPHISLKNAKAFSSTLLNGDPEELSVIKNTAKEMLSTILPGRS